MATATAYVTAIIFSLIVRISFGTHRTGGADYNNGEDILTALKASKNIQSCDNNVLLDPSVATFLSQCLPIQEGWIDKKISTQVGNSLLCVAYYDLNFKLCNLSHNQIDIGIPKDSTSYNSIISSLDNDTLKQDFCNHTNILFSDIEPNTKVSEYISMLKKELSNKHICMRLCFDLSESEILPICKVLFWGNYKVAQLLHKNKTIHETPKIRGQALLNITDPKIAISSITNSPDKPSAVPQDTVNISVRPSAPINLPAAEETVNRASVSAVGKLNLAKITALDDVIESEPNENKVAPYKSHEASKSKFMTPPKSIKPEQEMAQESLKPINNFDTVKETAPAQNNNNLQFQPNEGDESEQLQNQDEDALAENSLPTPKQDDDDFQDGQNQENTVEEDKLEPVPEKPDETQIKPEERPFKQIRVEDPFVNTSESHFFSMFLVVVALLVVIYIVFHNKNKILGLLIEGRHKSETRRSSSGPAYRRLDNLEQVVSSGVKTPPSNVIY